MLGIAITGPVSDAGGYRLAGRSIYEAYIQISDAGETDKISLSGRSVLGHIDHYRTIGIGVRMNAAHNVEAAGYKHLMSRSVRHGISHCNHSLDAIRFGKYQSALFSAKFDSVGIRVNITAVPFITAISPALDLPGLCFVDHQYILDVGQTGTFERHIDAVHVIGFVILVRKSVFAQQVYVRPVQGPTMEFAVRRECQSGEAVIEAYFLGHVIIISAAGTRHRCRTAVRIFFLDKHLTPPPTLREFLDVHLHEV